MKYTIDTEFWDRGRLYPVELISLGITAEDGRTWYGVNKDFDWLRLGPDDWLVQNVFMKLNANPNTEKTVRQMKADLLQFFSKDQSPEFWGYYADWDWLMFCHIFGPRIGGPPSTFPQLCLDIEQFRRHLKLSKAAFPVPDEKKEHNAGHDADWTMDCLRICLAHEKAQLALMGVGAV